ncbi:hypothetical protein BDZ97DRAFT_1911768 [Flammula alnicola]|nr:hypothetical protein BDZ97DRAFT_1911768 [Flammula alnicola]
MLPPAKMRALIALYHQADTWITPENLLERIDKAFVPAGVSNKQMDPLEIGSYSRVNYGVTFDEIETTKRVMHEAPKMAQWDAHAGASLKPKYQFAVTETWSANRAVREQKVIEALYGVVTTRDAKLLPGLEVLQETAEARKKHRENDRELDTDSDVPQTQSDYNPL